MNVITTSKGICIEAEVSPQLFSRWQKHVSILQSVGKSYKTLGDFLVGKGATFKNRLFVI